MSTRLEDIQSQCRRDQGNVNDLETEDMATPGIVRAIVSAASGVLFGIAIEKGRVFEPQVIRDQMLLKRFVMLKMFLSASAVGMLSFCLMSATPQSMRRMRSAFQLFKQSVRCHTVAAVAIGGMFLGCGMTLSGACPGTVAIQLGAGVPNAWITIAGGLSGATFYAVTDIYLTPFFSPNSRLPFSLNKFFGLDYITLALPLACGMAISVFGIEQYFPWFTEIPESLLTEGVMRAGAWPPFVTGIVVGMLQIPIVLANQDTLGSATSYVTVASQILPTSNGSSEEEYLQKYRSGMKNWWQVLYIGGAVCGGFLSAMASDNLFSVEGIPWYYAFGGGVLIIYGARLAGGCTSGHGLSGVGLLSLLSFVAVPAMFTGGIATAFFMRDVLQINI